jgi:hypothetical protein
MNAQKHSRRYGKRFSSRIIPGPAGTATIQAVNAGAAGIPQDRWSSLKGKA